MANDPERTANWYVSNFNFSIVSDTVTALGNRMVRCRTPDGLLVNVSGPRPSAELEKGTVSAHEGLDHMGLRVDDLDAEIARLVELGVEVLEGPVEAAAGVRFAFVGAPDEGRLELVEMRV